MMRQSRIVSLLGTVLIILWAGVQWFAWHWQAAWMFGHGWLNRSLLWFGVLLMVPAALLGWWRPKLSAYWIFLNIAIAASLDAAREWHNLVSPYLDRIGQVFSLIVSDILYWCLPFALAVCLLTALRSEARGRRLQESPKGNHTNV